jgi:REP element-mobilizing transposase RayT
MIPKECKRLAEVDFPVAEVSRHSAREKSIRHGHRSTLHLWWARRPLAACRAMLMALLLPDPCDENCPEDFKQEARRLLALMPGGAAVAPVPALEHSEGSSPAREGNGAEGSASTENVRLRKALLSFIADFANWDNSAKPAYLECARGLVRAAHGEEPPLVVDPFAGGGSIPLEALRMGCEAFASDLNPVACLILKVLLEDIPRHGPALADELRRVGKQIKDEAEKELAEFYPADPDGARPIAYLWARTVRCEAVGCGAEIPLMRSFWLCKKANRRRALRLRPLAHARGSDPRSDPRSDPSRERERADDPVTRERERAVPTEREGAAAERDRTARGAERERAENGGERAVPLAYFITFTGYGTWLHGKEPISVDRDHNLPGHPFVPPDPGREARERRLMKQSPYEMDAARRQVVLDAIREVARYRGWHVLAAHVRTTHVHVVVEASDAPERVMNDFKGYASRRLNESKFDPAGRKRWARHGSTSYLWKPQDVDTAVHYVVHGQGEPMAVFDGTRQFDPSREGHRAGQGNRAGVDRSLTPGGDHSSLTLAATNRLAAPTEPLTEPRASASGVGNTDCPPTAITRPFGKRRSG